MLPLNRDMPFVGPDHHMLEHAFAGALRDADDAVPQTIVGRGGEQPDKRFNVYRNNVAVSLVEALRSTYPALEQQLGSDFFAAMARVFIQAHPPQSPVLYEWGGEMAAFLERFAPVADYPYLPDLARIEWAWLSAYHAQDQMPMDAAILATVAADQLDGLRFRFHPSAHLVRSPYGVFTQWQASHDDGISPDADPYEHGEEGLIVRPDMEVVVSVLPAGGGAFIAALMEGAALGEAAEHALQAEPDFDLGMHLGGLLQSGALSALLPDDAEL